MATKKRQRNVKLLQCSKCNSLLMLVSATRKSIRDTKSLAEEDAAGANLNYILYSISNPQMRVAPPPPPAQDYEFRIKCLACQDEQFMSTDSPNNMKQDLEPMFSTFKSPQAIELQFKAFKFTGQKYSKQQVIAVGCKDRNGLPYQFKGESSVQILYGAVKDKWFSTRVCWQKFWSKGRGDLGWQTPLFIQRPKIVDDIILL